MGADYYQTIEDMRAEINAGIPRIGVGENTIIRRAIIDKNTRIGANVRLVNESGVENSEGDGENYFIRDRIIIVPKNAVIADGTVV
jgi:glucose-1-phosphate adenylyltransferase